jgi:hypothetical protein
MAYYGIALLYFTFTLLQEIIHFACCQNSDRFPELLKQTEFSQTNLYLLLSLHISVMICLVSFKSQMKMQLEKR